MEELATDTTPPPAEDLTDTLVVDLEQPDQATEENPDEPDDGAEEQAGDDVEQPEEETGGTGEEEEAEEVAEEVAEEAEGEAEGEAEEVAEEKDDREDEEAEAEPEAEPENGEEDDSEQVKNPEEEADVAQEGGEEEKDAQEETVADDQTESEAEGASMVETRAMIETSPPILAEEQENVYVPDASETEEGANDDVNEQSTTTIAQNEEQKEEDEGGDGGVDGGAESTTDMDSESVRTESPVKPNEGSNNDETDSGECGEGDDTKLKLKLVKCEPNDWKLLLGLFTVWCHVWFKIVRMISEVLDTLKIGSCKQGDISHTSSSTTNDDCDSQEISYVTRNSLNQWLTLDGHADDNNKDANIGYYDSNSHVIKNMIRLCHRWTMIKFRCKLATKLLHHHDEKEKDGMNSVFKKVRWTLKEMCEKFKENSEIVTILKQVKDSKDEDMIWFFRQVIDNVSTWSSLKWMKFEHCFLNMDHMNHTKQNEYMNSLMVFGMFHHYGMDLDDSELKHIRKSGRREHDALLMLLCVHLIERRSGITSNHSHNYSESENVKDLNIALMSEWNENTWKNIDKCEGTLMKLSKAAGATKGYVQMKDWIVWEIMMKNECLHLMNVNWPIDMLIRCMWVLKVARKFVNHNDVMNIKTQTLMVCDMTEVIAAKSLLCAVISGICHVYGVNDTTYRALDFDSTGGSAPGATLYGRFDKVGVDDLVQLEILKQLGIGRFIVAKNYQYHGLWNIGVKSCVDEKGPAKRKTLRVVRQPCKSEKLAISANTDQLFD